MNVLMEWRTGKWSSMKEVTKQSPQPGPGIYRLQRQQLEHQWGYSPHANMVASDQALQDWTANMPAVWRYRTSQKRLSTQIWSRRKIRMQGMGKSQKCMCSLSERWTKVNLLEGMSYYCSPHRWLRLCHPRDGTVGWQGPQVEAGQNLEWKDITNHSPIYKELLGLVQLLSSKRQHTTAPLGVSQQIVQDSPSKVHKVLADLHGESSGWWQNLRQGQALILVATWAEWCWEMMPTSLHIRRKLRSLNSKPDAVA